MGREGGSLEDKANVGACALRGGTINIPRYRGCVMPVVVDFAVFPFLSGPQVSYEN